MNVDLCDICKKGMCDFRCLVKLNQEQRLLVGDHYMFNGRCNKDICVDCVQEHLKDWHGGKGNPSQFGI